MLLSFWLDMRKMENKFFVRHKLISFLAFVSGDWWDWEVYETVLRFLQRCKYETRLRLPVRTKHGEHSVTVSSDIKQCSTRRIISGLDHHKHTKVTFVVNIFSVKVKKQTTHWLTGELRCPLEACWLVWGWPVPIMGQRWRLVSQARVEEAVLWSQAIQVTCCTDTRVVKAWFLLPLHIVTYIMTVNDDVTNV